MLVCAAKKNSELLTVPNIRPNSTGVWNYFLDLEHSISSSAILSNTETVVIEVL